MERRLESEVRMGSRAWADLRNLSLRVLIDLMMYQKVLEGVVAFRSMVIMGSRHGGRG